jgi:hypothetical protein
MTMLAFDPLGTATQANLLRLSQHRIDRRLEGIGRHGDLSTSLDALRRSREWKIRVLGVKIGFPEETTLQDTSSRRSGKDSNPDPGLMTPRGSLQSPIREMYRTTLGGGRDGRPTDGTEESHEYFNRSQGRSSQ